MYPFVPGCSTQKYFPYDEEENAAQYKKVQKQRELERKVRASKRECMMLKDGDPEAFQKASIKLKHNTQQLKTYCSSNDLTYMNERTSVMGYGRSEAGKVTAAYNRALKQETASGAKSITNSLTFSANGDTIKPYEIPVSREEVKEMVKRSNALEKPIFAKDTPDNKFASYVAKVKPEKGKYDVALHGSDKSAEFFGKPVDAYTLAKIIKSRKDYTVGTSVRLLSCNTGNTDETGNCFAQILANELKATVYAPSDLIIINLNGEFIIGDYADGEMKSFIWRE